MKLSKYNEMQVKIFKKYNVDCMIVNDIIKFRILCSKIAESRDCELTYSVVKNIIKEVRRCMKDEQV